VSVCQSTRGAGSSHGRLGGVGRLRHHLGAARVSLHIVMLALQLVSLRIPLEFVFPSRILGGIRRHERLRDVLGRVGVRVLWILPLGILRLRCLLRLAQLPPEVRHSRDKQGTDGSADADAGLGGRG